MAARGGARRNRFLPSWVDAALAEAVGGRHETGRRAFALVDSILSLMASMIGELATDA